MNWLTLHVAALLLTAAAFGGMLLFMTCIAPTVFRTLERPQAAMLMRALFPVYYLVLAVVLVLAALTLVPAGSYTVEIGLLGGTAAVFVVLRQGLVPRIERRREAGDTRGFARLHRLSVIVNLLQFAVVAVALVRLAR